MRGVVVFAVVCVVQLGLTTAQQHPQLGGHRYASYGRQVAPPSDDTTSSRFSMIPAFFRRMFGGRSASSNELDQSRGAPLRQFRRPGQGLTRNRIRGTLSPDMSLSASNSIKMSDLPLFSSPNGIPNPSTKSVMLRGPLTMAGAPSSLEGWVSYPTHTPRVTLPQQKRPVRSNKPGRCLAPAQYGIDCSQSKDQCVNDSGCPGVTRCCAVSACGRMCVRTNIAPSARIVPRGGASHVVQRQKEEEGKVARKNASGLKISDIAPTGP